MSTGFLLPVVCPAGLQSEIHELLLQFAEAGATVIRLKGGDPYVFGRSVPGLYALHSVALVSVAEVKQFACVSSTHCMCLLGTHCDHFHGVL